MTSIEWIAVVDMIKRNIFDATKYSPDINFFLIKKMQKGFIHLSKIKK